MSIEPLGLMGFLPAACPEAASDNRRAAERLAEEDNGRSAQYRAGTAVLSGPV